MELPSDVLKIISDYSKPILRVDLVRKYKTCMSMIGYSGWPMVEDKLVTDEADKVIELLMAYAEAKVAYNEALQVERSITKKTHPKQKLRWAAEEAAYQVTTEKKRKAIAAKTVLKVALVGEEELARLKREQEEREEAFNRAVQEDYEMSH
jgi:hypothetical protein